MAFTVKQDGLTRHQRGKILPVGPQQRREVHALRRRQIRPGQRGVIHRGMPGKFVIGFKVAAAGKAQLQPGCAADGEMIPVRGKLAVGGGAKDGGGADALLFRCVVIGDGPGGGVEVIGQGTGGAAGGHHHLAALRKHLMAQLAGQADDRRQHRAIGGHAQANHLLGMGYKGCAAVPGSLHFKARNGGAVLQAQLAAVAGIFAAGQGREGQQQVAKRHVAFGERTQHMGAKLLLGLLSLALQHQCLGLADMLSAAGNDVIPRIPRPEGILIQRNAFLRHAAKGHDAQPPIALGQPLHPLGRGLMIEHVHSEILLFASTGRHACGADRDSALLLFIRAETVI